MREQVIIQEFQALFQRMAILEQSLRLGVTGEMLRNEALQTALIAKGLLAQEDITKAIGEVIKKTQEKAAEQQAKPELILPTTEQSEQIQAESK